MMRSLAFISMCAVLAACSSDSSQPSEPIDVAIDTFNVALAGAFIPYEQERRQPIVDAIAATTSDVICLQEVWSQEDKELIRDGALSAYPHSALVFNDLDTPLDDPTDQQGEIPPAPTVVPCPDEDVGEANILDQMNDAVDCLKEFCSTTPEATPPEDELGQTTSETCATDNCALRVAGLLLGNEQQQRCYACVATQLPTATFGKMRDSCANVVNQDLAFDGQNGVMILSRHPLKNVENWVIPGTWNRRSILRATVELPNGSELDTYCNHLTPIFDSFTFPYTGQYGEGNTDKQGWQAEQELQAEKLIGYVNESSGERPAVILGDLNTGRAYPSEDIVAEGVETLDLLEGVFTPAYAMDYTPLCTFCSTNAVTNPDNDPEATSVWIDHILLHNLEAEAIVSTERVFDEDVVPVNDTTVPLSDHFGVRSVITVP
jgi:endonuclease/exonuclease/phosphatase family metal-dependent hydrolase